MDSTATATSSDGLHIHYRVSGDGPRALVLVHGWLGNGSWWDAQRDALADRFTIVQMDLGGHGASDRERRVWSAQQYADDIRAVADAIDAPEIVLVGHSMSGAYVTVAAPEIARTREVVLVDTLKNLDALQTPEDAAQMFAAYRADYRGAVENILPQYLFVPGTPASVRARLTKEFLAVDGARAVQLLEPLYRCDVRAAARRVTVPVRAINSDAMPTDPAVNRKYFRDYDEVTIAGTGHYPMLERPEEFTRLLASVVR